MSMNVSRPEETPRGVLMSVSRAPAPLLDTSMTVARPKETVITTSMSLLGAPETFGRGQPLPSGASDGGVAAPFFFTFVFGKNFSAAARPSSETSAP